MQKFYVFSLVSSVFSFAKIFLLAASLPNDEFGLYASITAIALLYWLLLTAGISESYLKLASTLEKFKSDIIFSGLIFSLIILMSVVSALLIVIETFLLKTNLSESYILLLYPYSLAYFLSNILLTHLRATGEFEKYSWFLLVRSIIVLVSIFILIEFVKTESFHIFLVEESFAVLTVFALGVKIYRLEIKYDTECLIYIKPLIKNGMNLSSALISRNFYASTDRLLIATMVSESLAGRYSIVLISYQACIVLVNPFLAYVAPIWFKGIGEDNLFWKRLRIPALSAITLLPVFILSFMLLDHLDASRFIPNYNYFSEYKYLIGFSCLFFFLGSMLELILIAFNSETKIAYANIICAILTLGALFYVFELELGLEYMIFIFTLNKFLITGVYMLMLLTRGKNERCN